MIFDCAVIGAGVMGCSTALHLARGGIQVALLDRGAVCGEASGRDAGAVGPLMGDAALIPYALRTREMWLRMPEWCEGGDVQAIACPGLVVAFTEADAAMLEEHARLRRRSAAPIALISGGQAMEIEPGLADTVLLAGHCPADGFANAALTGRAFRRALLKAGIALFERRAVGAVDRQPHGFTLQTMQGLLRAKRIVLAGGAWLNGMAAWLGLRLPITVPARPWMEMERMRPVIRSVIGIASDQLSLRQHPNGGVLIGGGQQRIDERGPAPRAEVLREPLRLAAHAIPALRDARLLRAWMAPEPQTADRLPAIGPLPGVPDAWIIGCGSGPYFGELLAQAMLGREPEMPLFPIDRLLDGSMP